MRHNYNMKITRLLTRQTTSTHNDSPNMAGFLLFKRAKFHTLLLLQWENVVEQIGVSLTVSYASNIYCN
jgi:hypothetical protein